MVTPGASGAFGDRQSTERRLIGLRVISLVLFVFLAVSFWVLQVLQYSEHFERAKRNHTRTLPLLAPRGVLFDRHGEVLVQNRRSFRIAIVREQATDVPASIRRLAAITHADEAQMLAIVQRRKSDPIFRPIAVIEHATDAQVAAVVAQQLELPEIVVEQVPTRTYPVGGLAAHLFGYVGEVQPAQLLRTEFAGLSQGAIVGQAGVEQVYNTLLMGTDGNRFVNVDSRGREVEELQRQDPVDGQRVQLTIDADMQRALEDAFRADGYNGAAAFIDPASGEVLALTSLPAYDPNDFAAGISSSVWQALNADPLRPLGNRLIQGLYMPGSTFKIVMAIAALEEGIITPDSVIGCRGSGVFYGRSFKCWNTKGHGAMTLRHAGAVVQRVLLHARRADEHRHDQQMGDEAGPGRQNRHRPAAGKRELHAQHRMGRPYAIGRPLVSGRNHLGGDWSGRSHRVTHGDGHDDGDGGQRRHVANASSGEGRRSGEGLGARARAGAAVIVCDGPEPPGGGPRGTLDGRQYAARYRHGPRQDRGQGCVGQDGHRTGDLQRQ
jgi:hypothetical protein